MQFVRTREEVSGSVVDEEPRYRLVVKAVRKCTPERRLKTHPL
jgi:hypothetical protein